MLAILAPQIPLAFLVARYAVARARRGEVPDWRIRFLRAESATLAAPRARVGFTTPARAQLWFEWRRQGRTLPALVAIVLPFELALFWIARGAPWLLLELLLLALFPPPPLASLSPATLTKANPDAPDALMLSPFIATRPVSSAELVAAKLTMAVWSTLATWLLVIGAVPLALIWSGNWPVVMERAGRLIQIVGMSHTIVFALVVLSGLMVSTWRQLVQSMYIGLTGRVWIGRAAAIGAVTFVVIIGPVVQWLIDNHRARALLWHSLPVLFATLVAIKMLAAAAVTVRLARSGLLSDRALISAVLSWVALVRLAYARPTAHARRRSGSRNDPAATPAAALACAA